jgi:Kdo2-lipid IVA lauroyltransferase/acyltransferase
LFHVALQVARLTQRHFDFTKLIARLFARLAASLFRLCAHLPLRLLHGLGAALGWLTYAVAPVYRARFQSNALQAGYTLAQVRPGVAHAGRLLAELPRLWMGQPVPMQCVGLEWIDQAHAAGQGIIFLTPHLGCFEVAAQAYAQRYAPQGKTLTVLYRPARKPWVEDIVSTARNRAGLQAAPATLAGVKSLVKALRSGQALGILPDQVPPQGMGVWAPFFGQPAYTMTLPLRLARQTGATLLLAFGERLPRGAGYRIHFRPFSTVLADTDEAAAAQMNNAMEALIQELPEQYLWAYARYKSPRGL